MALSYDGTPTHSSPGGGTSATVACPTTTNATDVLIFFSQINGGSSSASSITSVTDNSGVTAPWTRRIALWDGTGRQLEEWYTTTTGTLSGKTITVNYAVSAGFISLGAVAISGANVSSPFDSHAGLPVSAIAIGTADPLSISTTNANDLIIGCYRMNSTSTPTQGSGWTKDVGADYLLVEHQIVSAAQTNLSVTIGTGAGDSNGGIADAIVAVVTGSVAAATGTGAASATGTGAVLVTAAAAGTGAASATSASTTGTTLTAAAGSYTQTGADASFALHLIAEGAT